MTNLAQKIQALLFVTADELSYPFIAKTFDITDQNVKEAIQEIHTSLKESGLSLIITEADVKLTTSPAVTDFITAFTTTESKELSKAAAETLSLIAYRGPIARHDISVIRGVDSKRIVAQLMRRGLIKKATSTTEETLYEVSIEFMQHVGLTKKEDLPEFDKLSNNENIRRILTDTI